MPSITLAEIEAAIGYSAASAIQEYQKGDYGDPSDWTAERAADAELDGDAGQQIMRTFGKGAAYLEASEIYKAAFIEAWPENDTNDDREE